MSPGKWGLIEERADAETFVAYHVMPMIEVDGDWQASGAHSLSAECPRTPFMEHCGDLSAAVGEENEDGTLKRWVLWQHHDPDHDGALSEDEWLKRKTNMAKTERVQ